MVLDNLILQSRNRDTDIENKGMGERGRQSSGRASEVALVIKNPPAIAGDVTDTVRSVGGEDPLEGNPL